MVVFNKELKIKVIVIFLLEITSYNLNKLRVRRANMEDKLSPNQLQKLGKVNRRSQHESV